jgi:hypothetical protein
MNEIFDACVDLLHYLGNIVGLTYKEINVWIFVIIEPIIFIIMLFRIIHLRKKIKQLSYDN